MAKVTVAFGDSQLEPTVIDEQKRQLGPDRARLLRAQAGGLRTQDQARKIEQPPAVPI